MQKEQKEQKEQRQQKQYYTLFSLNLLRFIKAHGVYPVSKGIHANGNKFWVFELDGYLSEILTTWSNNKPKQKQTS